MTLRASSAEIHEITMNSDALIVEIPQPAVKRTGRGGPRPGSGRKPAKRLDPTPEQISNCPPGARLIPLTKGHFSIVDEADFERLSKYNWHHFEPGYAARNNVRPRPPGEPKTIMMHCEIMGIREGMRIDHKNMCGLDNRRENLRHATQSENGMNRGAEKVNQCGYKGVYLHKHSGLWIAKIMAGKKTHYLGYFKTPELAHAAYCEAAARLHGEFARVA